MLLGLNLQVAPTELDWNAVGQSDDITYYPCSIMFAFSTSLKGSAHKWGEVLHTS